jgi:hypothetical protein
MESIEREILQDIFMHFRYFGEYGNRHDGELMRIADEIIMKNAKKHLPEMVGKISKGS